MNYFVANTVPLTYELEVLTARTEFFPVDLGPMSEAHGPYINGERQRPVSYSTARENGVSKLFIISLTLIRRAGKETS